MGKKKDMRDREQPKYYSERFHEYHRWNATLENIFIQLGDKEAFCKSPPQKKNSTGNNQSKYCWYHRSTRNNMDNYRDLREEAEFMNNQGKYCRYHRSSCFHNAIRLTLRRPNSSQSQWPIENKIVGTPSELITIIDLIDKTRVDQQGAHSPYK